MSNIYQTIRLLNSAQMPCDGLYNKRTISKNQFIDIVQQAKIINSSIGYKSVSKLIKKITGIQVNVNRGMTNINDGDTILGLTLSYRVNSEKKGYTDPSEDDYVYFIATYKNNNEHKD